LKYKLYSWQCYKCISVIRMLAHVFTSSEIEVKIKSLARSVSLEAVDNLVFVSFFLL
jgi:hypothetical protein